MSEPTPPPPPAAADSGNRTLMLVLAYLFPLSLIPLLTEKEDKEVQWHAKHGIVLAVAFAILWVAAIVLSQIPFLACLVVTIMSIVKATQGQRFLIPGVSDFANKF